MNRNNGRLVFLWSNVNSKSNLGTDSKSYPSIFYCLDFVPTVPCQNIKANTDIFEISSQVNPELDKKKKNKNTKKAFIVYFPPLEIQPPHHLQNPFTTSLPNQHQKTISQYPHVSSHQKVTRQPKPFDPTTNKPHLSILATVEAPHQLLEKPATTTHKP